MTTTDEPQEEMAQLEIVKGDEAELQVGGLRFVACRREIDKFDGGPVGIDNLAAAISEERHTIEDVLEPYLIQQGFIMRTPRGRVVTRHAYLHFGLNLPSRMAPHAADLFDDPSAPDSP